MWDPWEWLDENLWKNYADTLLTRGQLFLELHEGGLESKARSRELGEQRISIELGKAYVDARWTGGQELGGSLRMEDRRRPGKEENGGYIVHCMHSGSGCGYIGLYIF